MPMAIESCEKRAVKVWSAGPILHKFKNIWHIRQPPHSTYCTINTLDDHFTHSCFSLSLSLSLPKKSKNQKESMIRYKKKERQWEFTVSILTLVYLDHQNPLTKKENFVDGHGPFDPQSPCIASQI